MISETKSGFDARPEEGETISRILDASTDNGLVDLLYTRRPDAYASYRKEPGEARVFVTRKDGVITATCAELIRNVYIGGEESKAAYICGLKKNPESDSSGIGPGFIRAFSRADIDFYFFGVLADNPKAKDMFEKENRLFTAKAFTSVKSYILSPRVRIKAPKHNYTFRRAEEADLPALLDFLDREGRKKDLFPVVRSLSDYHNLHIGDFCLLLDGEEILACGALWDSTDYKQYVVKRYHPLVKAARVLNPLIAALGFVRLPKENEPLAFPMLSFLLPKDGNEDLFHIFLNEVRKEVQKQYGMYVFDLPEGHFARKRLDRLPGVSFTTRFYQIRFPWNGQTNKTVDPNRLSMESGLL